MSVFVVVVVVANWHKLNGLKNASLRSSGSGGRKSKSR